MDAREIIIRKKEGAELLPQEIEFMVEGFTEGRIPDYQMSAFLMAVCFNGMTEDEIFHLTDVMVRSGRRIDLSAIDGIKVDKHSSGGVGDKISLIVCPVAAAAGVRVAKMSGRGLGFTGGTIDKLESVPGFRCGITVDEFIEIINENNMAIMSQSEETAKADRYIYALRDVTGTVDSPALIASSIMSKKIATGADALLLDVKFGDGALMKTREDAENLAELMKKAGVRSGMKVDYVLSSMEEPLGCEIGNACEIVEAIECLKGRADPTLMEEAADTAGRMIFLGGMAENHDEGKRKAAEMIRTGRALDVFRRFIELQGGDVRITEDYSLLPGKENILEITGKDLGISEGEQRRIVNISARKAGEAAGEAGAGRKAKGEELDHGAGVTLVRKSGDIAEADTVIFRVFGKDAGKVERAGEMLKKACVIE